MSAHLISIAIRTMTTADVNWALALADASPGAPIWPPSSYLSALDPHATPQRIALVAEALESTEVPTQSGPASAPAGFAIVRLLPPEAELENIVVAPGLQHRGVGRALLASLIRELLIRHVTEVTLEVRTSNQPAIALYRSLDFRESGRRTCYYVDPVEDALLMTLPLG
jgi:[ribosomal protein S18]-alanine N-acetyltransferase